MGQTACGLVAPSAARPVIQFAARVCNHLLQGSVPCRGLLSSCAGLRQVCQPCPSKAVCEGFGVEPAALPGFFMISRLTYLDCKPAVACAGGNVASAQCATGYTGEACSLCAEVRGRVVGTAVRVPVPGLRVPSLLNVTRGVRRFPPSSCMATMG